MALINNDGTPISIGAKPMAEREKDRLQKAVDRQKKQFADNPVKVCRNAFRNLQANVFNINHTRLSDEDLRLGSVEMRDDKTFIVTTTNRNEQTITDDDLKRIKGSMLITHVGNVESNGTLYIRFKLSCTVNDNKED